MGRSAYEWLWPLVRLVPSELAHELGLLALRAPLRWAGAAVEDPFAWRGHRFRNRVGVAAGLDKNGVALRGLAALGVGFVELGTVLARPHPGNAVRPRMRRLPRERGLWNRLGFPSQGAARVRDRLARTPLADVALAVNVAPHPLTVKSAESEAGFAARARAELFEIARLLHPWAAFFVLNASSPNTPGLRHQLEGGGFAQEIVAPLRAELLRLDAEARRIAPTFLLVKLPPEDAGGRPLGPDGLARLVKPFLFPDVCDGFVAINTSVALARAAVRVAEGEPTGGVSGAPLRSLAVEATRALAALAPNQLRIGVGGVMDPADACALVAAGAHLVELYTGLVYRGPGFARDCAAALRTDQATRRAGRAPEPK
jgi:dihydroorotate dehydrogenase